MNERMKKYIDESSIDFVWDSDNFQDKMYKMPILHNKWLRYFYEERNNLIQAQKQLLSLYRIKYYYYKDDYDHKLELKQIAWHIESDEEYSKKLYNVNLRKEVVSFIEKTIRRITSFSFDIKNIIEHLKFTNGQ